jgi:hypothetical protein
MSACWPVGIGIIQLRLHRAAVIRCPVAGHARSASSLAGLSAYPSAASSGLVEEARTTRYRTARKYRYRRPYYVPYACSHPYQYRYWQYYAPIFYRSRPRA